MSDPKQDPVAKLIFEFAKLPGIGEKTATRLTYYILKQEDAYAQALAQALLHAKRQTVLCSCCFTFTDEDPCRICSSPNRDTYTLCVVERPSDIFAIEQSGTTRWNYHVLHGTLSPLDGIGPEELKVRELLERIRKGGSTIKEVILATNPSVEGEATALYLAKLIKPIGIKATRLAHGLPVGGVIEYTDKQTLWRALENRVEIA